SVPLELELKTARANGFRKRADARHQRDGFLGGKARHSIGRHRDRERQPEPERRNGKASKRHGSRSRTSPSQALISTTAAGARWSVRPSVLRPVRTSKR